MKTEFLKGFIGLYQSLTETRYSEVDPALKLLRTTS